MFTIIPAHQGQHVTIAFKSDGEIKTQRVKVLAWRIPHDHADSPIPVFFDGLCAEDDVIIVEIGDGFVSILGSGQFPAIQDALDSLTPNPRKGPR